MDTSEYRSECISEPINQTTFRGGLGHMWPHSYSEVKANVSCGTLNDALSESMLSIVYHPHHFNQQRDVI